MKFTVAYDSFKHVICPLNTPEATIVSVSLSVKPLELQLKRPFGTSHSVTTKRHNALITVSLESNGHVTVGCGEAGLPPKKPPMYLADYDDVRAFVDTMQPSDDDGTYIPTAATPFFPKLRSLEHDTAEIAALRLVFKSLDDMDPQHNSAAARGAVECAILDCWGKLVNEPLYSVIGVSSDARPVFYTTALNTDLEEMRTSAEFGLKYTKYLKIKLDGDLDRCKLVLKCMESVCNSVCPSSRWAIDANAAWDVDIARAMLHLIISTYKHRVWVVEQPFPFNPGDEWAAIKGEYESEGVLLFADESVRDVDDIPRLMSVCHGVNIKLDKCGGHRQAVAAAVEAHRAGLRVWIGMMVGSCLASAAASHLLPLASCGDLDGSLLVDSPESWQTHVTWANGHVLLPGISHSIEVSHLPSVCYDIRTDIHVTHAGVGVDVDI